MEIIFKKVFGDYYCKDSKDKEKEKILNRVRERKSYKYFTELVEWLEKKERTSIAILKRIHRIIDDHRGFHSEQNSTYAEQSINLIEIDRGLE